MSPMSVTQAQALTRIREQIDEATASQWSDASLRRWINEAVKDIARRTKCFRASDQFATEANATDYEITTKLVQITHVNYFANGWPYVRPLTYVDIPTKDSFGWVASTWPQFYALWGQPGSMWMILNPAPPSDDDYVTYFYYKVPDDLATTTTADASTVLSIPEGWDDLIYLYAEYNARRRDQEGQLWIEAKQLYEQGLAELAKNALRWTDQVGQIADDWQSYEYYFGAYGRGR